MAMIIVKREEKEKKKERERWGQNPGEALGFPFEPELRSLLLRHNASLWQLIRCKILANGPSAPEERKKEGNIHIKNQISGLPWLALG